MKGEDISGFDDNFIFAEEFVYVGLITQTGCNVQLRVIFGRDPVEAKANQGTWREAKLF